MDTPNDLYSSSSTAALPLSPPDQYFQNNHYAGQNTMETGITPLYDSMNTTQTPNGFANPLTPDASIPPTPGSMAGRKRSRGDILVEDDDIEPDGSLPTPASDVPPMPRGEPVMGPGMTLVSPGEQGHAQAAESQSGTWVEKQAARKPFELQHLKRPSFSSRKSQRMAGVDPESDHLAQLVLPSQMRETTTEPLIDEATRTLGISWTRMDSSEALRINQAAYAKFIQNHYPGLSSVVIWFENSAIPGYLVTAQNNYNGLQEYYIFSHDLTEARLVTRDSSDLLPRLKMLPALHLAAPGGQIRAETDPITAVENEVSALMQTKAAENGALHARYQQPNGVCSANEIEMD